MIRQFFGSAPTLASGGVLAELDQDSVTFVAAGTPMAITAAIDRLAMAWFCGLSLRGNG